MFFVLISQLFHENNLVSLIKPYSGTTPLARTLLNVEMWKCYVFKFQMTSRMIPAKTVI